MLLVLLPFTAAELCLFIILVILLLHYASCGPQKPPFMEFMFIFSQKLLVDDFIKRKCGNKSSIDLSFFY